MPDVERKHREEAAELLGYSPLTASEVWLQFLDTGEATEAHQHMSEEIQQVLSVAQALAQRDARIGELVSDTVGLRNANAALHNDLHEARNLVTEKQLRIGELEKCHGALRCILEDFDHALLDSKGGQQCANTSPWRSARQLPSATIAMRRCLRDYGPLVGVEPPEES